MKLYDDNRGKTVVYDLLIEKALLIDGSGAGARQLRFHDCSMPSA
jgi:hypothetical protein